MTTSNEVKTYRALKFLMEADPERHLGRVNFWVCPVCKSSRNLIKNPAACPHCGFGIEGLITDSSEVRPYFPMKPDKASPIGYEIVIGPPSKVAKRLKDFQPSTELPNRSAETT